MRKVRVTLSLLLAIAPGAAILGAAQKPSEAKYEMTTDYLVLLYRGPNSTGEVTPEAQRIQEAHMANIGRMADEGKLILAGPMADDGKLRGIFVFRVASLEEAQALAAADPAVMAGRLVPEVHPWYTAKNIRVYPNAETAGAASPPPNQPAREAEQEIRELETRRFKAQINADAATLDRILSDDLTYVHSSAHVDTKVSYIASIRSGELKYVSIVPDELKVRVYGNTAVVTGRGEFKAQSQGQPVNIQLRFTDVYVRRDGRWQMVAWESTRIPNP